MKSQTGTVESPVVGPVDAVAQMVSSCCDACQCRTEDESGTSKRLLKKTAVMYLAMVLVSTCAIYFLEHATILNAVRTALVAAVGKTFAANWVASWFE